MTSPKVGIIVLNWNGVEDTSECLESLRGLNYPDYEIIVVDNGSVGDDVQLLRDRFGPDIHIIQNERNLGFAEGNNVGIREALSRKADYLLLLNNDTIVDTGFVGELVKVMTDDDSIGLACPKIYHYARPDTIQFVGGRISYIKGRVYHHGYDKADTGQYDNVSDIDFATGCAVILRRDLIEKVGLLGSSYFTYCEDWDFSVRVRKTGLRIVLVPKAKIWHKGSASTGGYLSPLSYYFYIKNSIRFVLQHGKPWQRIFFLIYYLLIYPFLLLGYSVLHWRWHLIKPFCRGVISYFTNKDYYDLTRS